MYTYRSTVRVGMCVKLLVLKHFIQVHKYFNKKNIKLYHNFFYQVYILFVDLYVYNHCVCKKRMMLH